MNQRQGRGKVFGAQIAIIGSQILAEHQTLVDDGARGHRYGIVATGSLPQNFYHAVGDHLPANEQLALEMHFIADHRARGDENLTMPRFGLSNGDTQNAVVDRYITPSDNAQALLYGGFTPDALDLLAGEGLARHEQIAQGIIAGSRQLEI